MLKSIIFVLSLCLIYTQKDPPVWPESFTQKFVEEFFINGSRHVTTGQHWYDAAHNRSKFIRGNGANNALCNSVQPGNLECEQLIVGGNRYIIFPQLKKGCLCCTAAQGCGILRRDWLNGAKYEGIEVLSGQGFDKWAKPDGDGTTWYFATTDQLQVPRRLNEANEHILEYLMNTYTTGPIADNVFDLPSYVSGNCPSTSKCAKFTGEFEE
jgi:hypothetical protein